jgi:hypothetical protein
VTCPDTAAGLGAYVLGALEPGERRRVEEHLRSCPACAAELAEFRALPELLDRVRPVDLSPVAVAPSPGLFDRLVAAADEDRRRARRRYRIAAAAAVLAVLAAGAGVTSWAARDGEQAYSASAGSVHLSLTATAQRDGTALDVTVAGLPAGEHCRLFVLDRDGGRHAAGEWAATYSGDASFRGWTEVQRSALAGVVLLGTDGRQLVALRL